MKRITLYLSLIMLALPSFAQDMNLIHRDMRELIETKRYKELLDFYLKSKVEYDAEMLFNIGYAYLNTGEYEKAIEYLASSQEADPSKITPSLLIGSAYHTLGDNKKALQYMEPAIGKEWIIENQSDVDYYVHHSINVAQVYCETDQFDKAEALLQKAKGLLNPKSAYYGTLMLNIASLEIDKGLYDTAQSILEELVGLNRSNYHAIVKLIQVHHHNNNYEAVDELRTLIYRGNVANELPKVMRDIFCIDKFEYKGKSIQAFERYQDGKYKSPYDKHLFYVFGEDGKLEYTIKTEYVYKASNYYETGPNYFAVCSVAPNNEQTNFDIQLQEGYNYKDLKEIVLKLLDNY